MPCMTRSMHRLATAMTATIVALLALAAPAAASYASVVLDLDPLDPDSGYTLRIREDAPAADQLRITRSGTGNAMVYVFASPGGITDEPTTGDPGGRMADACRLVGPDLQCRISDGIDRIRIEAGTGDDTVDSAGLINSSGGQLGFSINGGDGNDLLHGPNVYTEWPSSAGDDRLFGGTDQDSYLMGAISDGNDEIHDRAGLDLNSMSYAGRTSAVRIQLGGTTPGASTPSTGELDLIDARLVSVQGGAGADVIQLAGDGTEANGNAGSDLLMGGSGADELYGGRGNDRLYGGGGADRMTGGTSNGTAETGADDLHGGAGNDEMFSTTGARDGADDYWGDAGIDTMSYEDRRDAGVVVSIDNAANDGRLLERDNVHTSVENLVGSRRADRLTGSILPNRIEAGPGNDLAYGGGGNDMLYGGSLGFEALADGLDRLFGDAGNDLLHVSDGTGGDRIDGGAGRDTGQRDGGDAAVRVESFS